MLFYLRNNMYVWNIDNNTVLYISLSMSWMSGIRVCTGFIIYTKHLIPSRSYSRHANLRILWPWQPAIEVWSHGFLWLLRRGYSPWIFFQGSGSDARQYKEGICHYQSHCQEKVPENIFVLIVLLGKRKKSMIRPSLFQPHKLLSKLLQNP